MFSKLLNLFRPRPAVRKWEMTDDPEVVALRRHADKGQWGAIEAHFATLQNSSDRGYFVSALSERDGRPAFLERWVETCPNSALAWLVRGANGVNWAWEARTGALAEDVDESKWPVFFQRLRAAQADLQRAVSLDSRDPTPFGPLIAVAIGLQQDPACVESHVRSATALDPEHDWSHTQALTYFSQKWHGSHEAMFSFARNANRNRAPGCSLGYLICQAHLNRFEYAIVFDKDRDFAASYWNDPQVKEEIAGAYRQSLGSSAYRPTKLTRVYRNLFAFCLARSGSAALARAEFDHLGGLYDDFPWSMLRSPAEAFVKYRDESRSA